MAGDSRSVAPTYDLRALGEGLEVYERLDRLADEVLAVAEGAVGEAFVRVPAFAARAREEAGREDERFRRTTKERYLVELLACVVMARQFWDDFAARSDTVVILPHCLAIRGERCRRERTRYGARCTACHPRCTGRRLTETAVAHGGDAYFSDRDHAKQFRALVRGGRRDLSVVGVACLWMLANGMRAAEEAGVPSQGVLLSSCGCAHWTEPPVVTDACVERLETILAAKDEVRRTG